jgi:hypothetical protein
MMVTSWRISSRRVWVGVCLLFAAAACGGGTLSLSEYAEEGEKLVIVVSERIDTLDAEWESQTPSAEGARDYWDQRVDARVEFLEGLQELDPPAEAVELHGVVVNLFDQLTTAEKDLAARVATFETVDEHWQWFGTPEGRAARTADENVSAICRVVQAEFDATEDREIVSDMPWISPGMKEIVRVAFGCPP